MNHYEYLDGFSAECDAFHEYACDYFEAFKADLEQRKCRKVISTYV